MTVSAKRGNERIQFWRGLSANMAATDVISGQILFQEDTGDVFLDYRDTHPTLPSGEDNPDYGQLIRVKLTDSDKADIAGDTFTGQVFLFPTYTLPIEDNEAVPKKYVDDIETSIRTDLENHTSNTEIHITQEEREAWNNKVDKEDGKGLSTNDFTNELKEKVERSTHVEYESANVVDNDNIDQFNDLGTISIDDVEYHIYAPIQTDISGNAETATKLKNPVSLDGISFDGSKDVCRFGICTTDVDVDEKTVFVDEFELHHGSIIVVKFTELNTCDEVYLNVSNTGKYPIWYCGSNVGTLLKSGSYQLVFTEESVTGEIDHYSLVAGIDTQYELVSDTEHGLMRAEDYVKLKTVEEYANNYKLPVASDIILGGVMIGDNIYIDDGVISVRKEDIVSALGYTPMSLEDGIDIDVLVETIGVFSGATNGSLDEDGNQVGGEDGQEGLVPAPYAGDEFKFLQGSGSWEEVPLPEVFSKEIKTPNPDYIPGVSSDNPEDPNYEPKYDLVLGVDGLVPAPSAEDINKVLSSEGTWISIDGLSGSGTSVTPITKEEIDEMLKDINIGIGTGGSCSCSPLTEDEIKDAISNSSVEFVESMNLDEVKASFDKVFGGSK